jgi:hypothetical protein
MYPFRTPHVQIIEGFLSFKVGFAYIQNIVLCKLRIKKKFNDSFDSFLSRGHCGRDCMVDALFNYLCKQCLSPLTS